MSLLAGRRVLVVEDEPIIAMCLEDILENLGCTVLGPARTVADSLRLVEDEAPDLAILDINLGGERSYDLAERLTKLSVPFAFASGYSGAPDGFSPETPLIQKPYREPQVEQILLALTHRAAA
ncbi:MAG: response regulator [Pseudomonadota bacterium]